MESFQRLNAGHLIGAHQVDPLRMQIEGVSI